MVLRIRLARPGPAAKRHLPLYNIVLAQARTARDSKPMEVLGTYNPTPQTPLATSDKDAAALAAGAGAGADASSSSSRRYKDLQLDISRTKYWLGVGAQPTETVARLFSLIGLVELDAKFTKTGTYAPPRPTPASKTVDLKTEADAS